VSAKKVPGRQELVDMAIKEAGYNDFGDPWFFKNLDVLVPILNDEAQLSDSGVDTATGMFVRALVNRLRFQQLLTRHPEIDDEEVSVVACVAGLPRTGSTMLHRIMAASPNLTGIRWYETQNYMPFPDEKRGNPQPRREAGQQILNYMLQTIPDLMSIHPMDIEQPDEEVIILGQMFSSTMMEGTFYVPSFTKWLNTQDTRVWYRDLKRILKAMQWWDPTRAGKKWILKTPGNLIGMDGVFDSFPEAKIVMTHRTPVESIPSYCSMQYSLYQMVSDTITKEMVGAFIEPRLHEWLSMFMAARDRVGEGRFIDIDYKDQLTKPVETASRVIAEVGLPVSPEVREAMDVWAEGNKREDRAPHKYTLEDFGLTREQVATHFGDYINRFIDKK
jgi:hypothetical protein